MDKASCSIELAFPMPAPGPEPSHAAQVASTQVPWTASASGDRFPVHMDTGHPLWQTFLDSGSISPTQFFRAFLTPPSYFHSPTPWQDHGRIAQKVSELLDAFRPGSYSYRPFRKEAEERSRVRDDNNNNTVQAEVIRDQPRPIEDPRRRVYVDLGRPRPFYRRHDYPHLSQDESQPSSKRTPIKSLQELVRSNLVKTYGLSALKEILDSKVNPVPCLIRDQALTFVCRDFEEVSEAFVTGSPGMVRKTGSYKVKCLDDDQTYVAVFATSEVDKHVSNLWEELQPWLGSSFHSNFVPILALVADPLTENVFFIIPDLNHLDDLEFSKLNKTRTKLVKKFDDPFPHQSMHASSFFKNNDGKVLMQNPILHQSFRCKLPTLAKDRQRLYRKQANFLNLLLEKH